MRPKGLTTAHGSRSLSFRTQAEAEFGRFVGDAAFPCLGAKAAWNSGSYRLATYEELAAPSCTDRLAADLRPFTKSETVATSDYATFVAVFRGPLSLSEQAFEKLLWKQLQQLSQIDRKSWDPSVSEDAGDPHFSFSFAGRALYVVGLHNASSRLARRFRWPALVFNPHEQFEKLRTDGKWQRMQQTIRGRDIALQGSVNPMLSDFGESSEARQYSGRAVPDDWMPPVVNPEDGAAGGRCPFAH